MTKQAAEARRAYKRNWTKNNPDKVKQYQQTYWEKQAAKAAADTQNGKADPARTDREGEQI